MGRNRRTQTARVSTGARNHTSPRKRHRLDPAPVIEPQPPLPRRPGTYRTMPWLNDPYASEDERCANMQNARIRERKEPYDHEDLARRMVLTPYANLQTEEWRVTTAERGECYNTVSNDHTQKASKKLNTIGSSAKKQESTSSYANNVCGMVCPKKVAARTQRTQSSRKNRQGLN